VNHRRRLSVPLIPSTEPQEPIISEARRELSLASPLASLLMIRSARALAPALALFSLTVVSGLCASTYGDRIATASSVRAAAPFAAPFALLASLAGASFALAAAAGCDAAEKLSR